MEFILWVGNYVFGCFSGFFIAALVMRMQERQDEIAAAEFESERIQK